MDKIEQLRYEIKVREAAEKGVEIESNIVSTGDWERLDNPSWDHYKMRDEGVPFHKCYRIHDPYREFKEAEKAGKIVQYKSDRIWIDGRDNGYCFPPERYRIKPDEPMGVVEHGMQYYDKPKPKYRPYDDAMELKGKWLKDKGTTVSSLITSIDSSPGNNNVFVQGKWSTLKAILEYYIHEDGTPCGILVKEDEGS